jgi:pimeloyl-ACP methyl ester carboxylesterase
MKSFPLEAMQVKQKRVNGINLAFVEEGTGETVVFVHGANGDWRTWDSLRSYIAEKYQYVALSRRYHQPNPWPGDGSDYSLLMHVEDLAAFIRALGVGPAHLVGGSYGGWVAVLVALQYPDLVKSLVLSEPGLINAETPEAKAVIAEWDETLMPPVRQALQEGDTDRASILLWNAVNDPRFNFASTPQPRQERWLGNGNTLPLLFNAPPSQTLTCEQLASLTMPILVIGSEYIRPYFRQSNDRLLQCLHPGIATTVVPDAPHAWYPVNPQAGAEAILTFLNAL